MIPFSSKIIIDEVLPSQNISLLHFIVLAVALLGVMNLIVGAVRAYYTTFIMTSLANRIELAFFNHLQHLPMNFFETHRVGEVGSRFSDVRNALTSFVQIFSVFVINLSFIILIPPILFALQPQLAVASLVLIPIVVLVAYIFRPYVRRCWKSVAEAGSEMNGLQFEALSQIKLLKVLTAEKSTFNTLGALMRRYRQALMSATGANQLYNISVNFLSIVNTAIYSWIGWTFILNQTMTLGEYIAFSMYVSFLYGPLFGLAALSRDIQQTLVSATRMFEYHDIDPEQDPSEVFIPAYKDSAEIHPDKGITVKDVCFDYKEGVPVLQRVSLSFPVNTISCLVGPSGCGKTTLVRLLIRFNEPRSGTIEIGGVPLSRIPVQELRRHITVVMQDCDLVQGTIWSNLVLGCENPLQERVNDAIRICKLEDFIRDQPTGFQTPIAEWGSSISGGQRQRIALARAYLRGGSIFILDEATSNLDAQLEAEILRDLFAAWAGRTIIFITHRLAHARYADQVCVMLNGAVVDIGTHSHLLEYSILYRDMFNSAVPVKPDAPRGTQVMTSTQTFSG